MREENVSDKFVANIEMMIYVMMIYCSFIFVYLLKKNIIYEVMVFNVLNKYGINFFNFEIYAIAAIIGSYIFYKLFKVYESYTKINKSFYEIVLSTLLPIVMINIIIWTSSYTIARVPIPFMFHLKALAMQAFLIILFQSIFVRFKKLEYGNERILIVHNNIDKIFELKRKVKSTYGLEHIDDINTIKTMGEIQEKIKLYDKVMIDTSVNDRERKTIISKCMEESKEIYLILDVRDVLIYEGKLDHISDIPVFKMGNFRLSIEQRFVKRMSDICISLPLLILTIPIMVVIAIVIKLDGGAALFKQERLTVNKKTFKLYKFRSMCMDAESKTGPVLASEDDIRITKVGKFIRKTRLDELPQLINVLKGEMSIVGPRPERECFVNQFVQEIPEYEYRMNVKAGITGLAQVMGKYNTSFEDKLKYDLLYIKNYTIIEDIKLILMTVKVMFLKESTEGVKQTEKMAKYAVLDGDK